MKEKDDRFNSRKDIRDWLNATTPINTEYKWAVCGSGIQCPALAQSRFGFHVRGDSFGANSLFDTILSDTVPITMREQYDIHPDWFDWDKISFFADVTNKTVFVESVQRIINDKVGYELKLKNILLNKVLFDWTTDGPFDTYMYMLSQHLWPWLGRLNHTRYSVLRLP